MPSRWRSGIHASSTTSPTSTTTRPNERLRAFGDALVEHVPRREAELGAHRERDREAEDDEARRRAAGSGGAARAGSGTQHLRVPRVVVRCGLGSAVGHESSSDADSASRYSVAFGWRRRIDAGHAVVIGPCSASRTGAALRASGTIASTRRRAHERGDRDGDRVRRHVVDRREVPFADLLAARRGLERDDLHVDGIVEVGDGRIVEREVPVLADPAAAQVERMRRAAASAYRAASASGSAVSPWR